ncbi:DnaA/Hda family protein [Thermogutta sp.]|uniref:DnaA ATPase domain-containing protein n=1 Tax=Thermogutta sp. TaxID=1962930 RepID=UPI00321FC022
MTRDEKEVISALRKVLADKVGYDRYALWFGRRTRFLWDGARLTLQVANSFYVDWIRTVFHDAIEEACKAVFGKIPEVHYEWNENLSVTEDEEPILSRPTTRSNHDGTRAVTATAKRASSRRTTSSHTHPPSLDDLPLFAHAARSCEHSAENDAASPGCITCDSPTTGKPSVSGVGTQETPGTRETFEDAPREPECFAPHIYAEGPVNPGKDESPLTTGHCVSSQPSLRIICHTTDVTSNGRNRQDDALATGEEPLKTSHVHRARTTPTPLNPQSNPGHRADQSGFADLETFVVGDCNRLAYAAAETVTRKLGSYSPLVIHGPSGVGKTHLLEGIWKGVKKRNPRVAALYLSAEQFTSAYVEALQSGTIPVFRQKYRGVQLFILDDLQFFGGKRQTQIELLYTLDSLMKNGCQVVCAADRPPSELRELTPELRSRLEGGIVCRIDPPDFATRAKIVENFCLAASFALDREVQQWVAESFARSVRQLIGALRRLEAAAKALKRAPDCQLASEILSDLLPEGTKQVTLADIEREVCRAFALPPGALQSDRKDRTVAQPRMLAMWLARKCTRANLSEIGRFFGRRSHATVISAQKRVEEWLSGKETAAVSDGHRSIWQTIHEIERRLRTG